MSNKDREIIIRVEGGLIQSIENIPDDVTVRVCDYDVENGNKDDIATDDYGDECYESIYKSEHPLRDYNGIETSVESLLLLDDLAGEIKGIIDLLYNATKSEIGRIRCEEIEERVSTIQGECSKLINKIENPNS